MINNHQFRVHSEFTGEYHFLTVNTDELQPPIGPCIDDAKLAVLSNIPRPQWEFQKYYAVFPISLNQEHRVVLGLFLPGKVRARAPSVNESSRFDQHQPQDDRSNPPCLGGGEAFLQYNKTKRCSDDHGELTYGGDIADIGSLKGEQDH